MNHLRNEVLCWARKKVGIVHPVDFGVLLSILHSFRKNVYSKYLIQIKNKIPTMTVHPPTIPHLLAKLSPIAPVPQQMSSNVRFL